MSYLLLVKFSPNIQMLLKSNLTGRLAQIVVLISFKRNFNSSYVWWTFYIRNMNKTIVQHLHVLSSWGPRKEFRTWDFFLGDLIDNFFLGRIRSLFFGSLNYISFHFPTPSRSKHDPISYQNLRIWGGSKNFIS